MSLHFSIHCDDCGIPMLLPAHVIHEPFSNPDSQPNDSVAIGAACPSCLRLERYFLQIDHPYHNPRHKAFEVGTQPLDTIHVSTLKCVVETCKSRLPLFAQWNPDTTAEERKSEIAEGWMWERLKCPEGHLILKPHFRYEDNPRKSNGCTEKTKS